jgi:hypothetical protein
MKKYIVIVLTTVLASCAANKSNEVKPGPFNYKDCMTYVNSKEFCTANSTK